LQSIATKEGDRIVAGYEYYKKRLEPSSENKVFVALMYASHLSDRVAAVFTKGGEINYASGMDVFKREEDADWIEAAANELTREETEAIYVVRKVWAFSSNVADEEIEDWDKPIWKHPDSLEVFEVALMTRIFLTQWTVTFTARGKNLTIDDVYETEDVHRLDDRFLKLEIKEDEKAEKAARDKNSKETEEGKVVGFIGPRNINK
jgi:hypothetical protein